MTAVIPEGLEPLAVWDGRARDWWRGWTERQLLELDDWLQGNLGLRGRYACRVEFYLLDAAFAIVTAYKRDECGFKYQENGRIAVEPPVIVPLAALPPAHLLRA